MEIFNLNLNLNYVSLLNGIRFIWVRQSYVEQARASLIFNLNLNYVSLLNGIRFTRCPTILCEAGEGFFE